MVTMLAHLGEMQLLILKILFMLLSFGIPPGLI